MREDTQRKRGGPRHPSHYSPHILLAVDRAAAKGLRVPLVYNTCGREKVEIQKTLDGVVDIYPEFKYADGPMAERYPTNQTDACQGLTQPQ